MASTVTNRLAATALERLIAGKSYRMMLLTGNSTGWQTAATARDFNVVEDVADDEASDASYARQDVALSVVEDDTNDIARLHYGSVTFPSLAADVGQILGVCVYEVVNDDSDHIIVALHDVESLDKTPDGSHFLVRAGDLGAIQLETS